MTNLKLVFECGECNGFMHIELYANDSLLVSQLIDSTTYVVDTQVEFPIDLRIKVSGKNLSTDTLLEDGKIVKDKYIKLKQMHLARYPINESVLLGMCNFTPKGRDAEHTNYFYCDGTALLQFRESDTLRWHLANNKY